MEMMARRVMKSNKISFWCISFLIITGCAAHQETNKIAKNNQLSDKVIRSDSMIISPTINKSGCIAKVDTDINGLILSDSRSFLEKYGNKYSLIDPETDCIYLSNFYSTEFLTLHHENGGDSNSFDIFTISQFIDSAKFIIKTKDKNFISSNGISIGMDVDNFLKIYDKKCFVLTTKGNKLIYTYRDEFQTYLAVYTFIDNLLIEFRIGYDGS